MALSRQIQLARAQRKLRRLEEDAAALGSRLAEISEEHRKPMQRWFHEIVEQQRDTVRRLEVSPDPGSDRRTRRSTAA